ncbi:hypothetical protein QBC39DRAFT_375676 [Podospora conica]|nr:hypothetical protein QBC39DRAFT_375676 [Schizothecium conicum]
MPSQKLRAFNPTPTPSPSLSPSPALPEPSGQPHLPNNQSNNDESPSSTPSPSPSLSPASPVHSDQPHLPNNESNNDEAPSSTPSPSPSPASPSFNGQPHHPNNEISRDDKGPIRHNDHMVRPKKAGSRYLMRAPLSNLSLFPALPESSGQPYLPKNDMSNNGQGPIHHNSHIVRSKKAGSRYLMRAPLSNLPLSPALPESSGQPFLPKNEMGSDDKAPIRHNIHIRPKKAGGQPEIDISNRDMSNNDMSNNDMSNNDMTNNDQGPTRHHNHIIRLRKAGDQPNSDMSNNDMSNNDMTNTGQGPTRHH